MWSFWFRLPIHSWWKWFELQYSVISTTQFVPNSNYESVKQQNLCQIRPLEIQIAQYHFNSTTVFRNKVTKHSDFFVWKDTSERVARRCDDTVDRKRMHSCVLKHLSLEGVEQPKKWPTNPGNTLSDALLMSCFQYFAADTTKKTALCAVFCNCALHGFN